MRVNRTSWDGTRHKSLRKEFDSNIKFRFGSNVSPDDSPYINLEDIPLCGMYEDDTTYVEGGFECNTEYDEDPTMATELDHKFPTPEENDNYVNASVMFPRGNSYARKEVIGRKIDADGNAGGRSNDNPIIDTREDSVEFDDEEVSELTTNVIAE